VASGRVEPDSARRLFSGRVLGLTLERWANSEREIVERVDSVAVVAVDEKERVVLVRQFREPARRELLELPAGTMDAGEEPLVTARRELAEETGFRGGRWSGGPVLFTTPGFCRERIHLFFADELESGEAAPVGDERIGLVRWPRDEIASRLEEIEDAKTLVGLLLHLRRQA
jgi:ADP-ribose pyrophosphatase